MDLLLVADRRNKVRFIGRFGKLRKPDLPTGRGDGQWEVLQRWPSKMGKD